MNVGLLYTPVSIFQMTRGALVLFVGILSVLFLRRRLHLYQWLALIIVMGGVAVVGLSGSLVKQVLHSDPQQLEVEDGPPPETSVLIGASFLPSIFLLSRLSMHLSSSSSSTSQSQSHSHSHSHIPAFRNLFRFDPASTASCFRRRSRKQ